MAKYCCSRIIGNESNYKNMKIHLVIRIFLLTNVVQDDAVIQSLDTVKQTENKIGNSLTFTQLSFMINCISLQSKHDNCLRIESWSTTAKFQRPIRAVNIQLQLKIASSHPQWSSTNPIIQQLATTPNISHSRKCNAHFSSLTASHKSSYCNLCRPGRAHIKIYCPC